MLPVLISELRRLAPGVSIEAERISAKSAFRTELGDVDLAVGYMPSLQAGFYQQTLFRQGCVCLVARRHSRITKTLTLRAFSNEAHVVVVTQGPGHSIVERAFEKKTIHRNVVLRVSSFLGGTRLVGHTELIANVPSKLGEVLAGEEKVKMFPPPVPLPTYAVKLHWHGRFHADQGNGWLRKTVACVISV